jgi:AraC-like DNA-binding protein
MYTETGDARLIPPRTHTDSLEIMEVVYGEVEVRIGTEFVYAMAGDFICVPHSLVFSVYAVGGNSSVRGVIFSIPSILADMDKIDTELLYMFYLQSQNRIAHFKSGHPLYPMVEHCMKDAYDEYILRDVCYKMRIRADIYLTMSSVLRYYFVSKDREGERAVYHNVLRMRPVIEYIGEHFCEKIYIEKLAGMLDVSPDYFTKMFRDSIGKTPIDYINGLRINRAMQILADTDDSMADIADEIGFCNPNYFHKIFKQYIDMSPLAYRKSTRQ